MPISTGLIWHGCRCCLGSTRCHDHRRSFSRRCHLKIRSIEGRQLIKLQRRGGTSSRPRPEANTSPTSSPMHTTASPCLDPAAGPASTCRTDPAVADVTSPGGAVATIFPSQIWPDPSMPNADPGFRARPTTSWRLRARDPNLGVLLNADAGSTTSWRHISAPDTPGTDSSSLILVLHRRCIGGSGLDPDGVFPSGTGRRRPRPLTPRETLPSGSVLCSLALQRMVASGSVHAARSATTLRWPTCRHPPAVTAHHSVERERGEERDGGGFCRGGGVRWAADALGQRLSYCCCYYLSHFSF